MFPIRDHNPSERTPYVTIGLIFANLVMFLLTMPWGLNAEGLWVYGALYAGAVTQGDMMWGLLTHMFLHAGLMHFAGNMLFLWIFGDNLEDQLGHLPFLGFYLICGLAAAAGQISAEPGSTIPMVGASGAIAGVMGGYLLLFPRARVDVLAIIVIIVKVFTLPAWVMLGVWFALQLMGGYTTPGDSGGVAYWAHSGGFVAGALLTLPVLLRKGGSRFWSRTDGHPPHDPIDYGHRSRVPQIPRR
ncbi:MAG: rhomboid family intramembrane serine protease [Paracoccus sp. (in: a-proteobacteria)]|uniref:rhomboid family intramembrane serine protease n=1 Tax=Paracoccus sp. TaxID=267 RepID=UPI0026DF30EF|nr:rhomboid family intramembrane serine protease [Paracoccus sp. (in: a-proteobacteria)]MDO5613647.1 rhomboid family intramembrane serine protease [Paracoccus sp. (in: a-proteobacteria)]